MGCQRLTAPHGVVGFTTLSGVKPMTFSRAIAAPAHEVWAVLADISSYPSRFTKIDAVDLLTDGPFDVGTRWRETRTVYGQSGTVELRVIECQRSRRYRTESLVDARATMQYRLTPSPDGSTTAVQVTFETTGGSLAYRIQERLYRARLVRCAVDNNDQDLADLAGACEVQIASWPHYARRPE
jgi:uncharacterized membrane protein